MSKGIVLITAKNCEKYIQHSIESLSRQKYSNFEIIFVDDSSDDDTFSIALSLLEKYFEGNYVAIRNEKTIGKAANAFLNLKNADADFVAILDGDDRLIDDTILGEFASYYRQEYDVVYSNYKTNDGRVGFNDHLNPQISPRQQGWKTSHFFSFRLNLFKNIPESYFKDENEQWLTSACDFSIAFPVLDQTRRYKYIPRISYEYTANNVTSHHNKNGLTKSLNSPEQKENAQRVLEKPALPLINSMEQADIPFKKYILEQISLTNTRIETVSKLIKNNFEININKQLAKQRLVLVEGVPLSWLNEAGGWSIEPQVYEHLLKLLDRYKNPKVLEFGSGAGSKILHSLVHNRNGLCISIEHDKNYFEKTVEELKYFGIYHESAVIHTPLIDTKIFEIDTKFYDMSWLRPDAKFDLVVIDGPPMVLSPLSRLAAFPMVATNLNDDFTLVLDDYEREAERKIVELWRKLMPQLVYEEVKFEKSICVIHP